MRAEPVKTVVDSFLKKFATRGGEKKLKIASLWEESAGKMAGKAQILKVENNIIFIKVPSPIFAQELKLKAQRKFIEEYEKEFGERLKDVRFLIGS